MTNPWMAKEEMSIGHCTHAKGINYSLWNDR